MPARPARWRSGGTRWQNSTWWPEAQLAGNLFWARTGDQLQGPPISRKPIAGRAWLVRWFGWAAGAPQLYCGQRGPKLVKKDPKIGQERPLIGQRGPKIGQEGPQNWPRRAPDWSRKTHNWFCFLAKYAKHVGAGCSGQMWVAFGDLPSMYVLCNCIYMIRISMMMITRKLCCLCNPMIQQ